MNVRYINTVKECLEENLHNSGAFFVFSTDIASRTWADWCVLSGKCRAVAMERFMAWDRFKGSFLRAREDGKTAVPALMRKLFVQDFIRRNAERDASDPDKLKKIIAPEYASSAASFADYLSSSLPSLNLWNTRMELYRDEYGTPDLEDRDYRILYEAYRDFLEKNSLFEPSWVQDMKFEEADGEFFILFPELLEDFEDYAPLFSQARNITACRLPQEHEAPKSYAYPDSRSELRQTILQIIDLVQNQKKFDWTDVALSVPDLDTYRPYLERELELYDVPFVIRSGIPLDKNCAGRIFKSIQNCWHSDFSYDSVRTLLLDECIPWKKSTVLPLIYTEDGKRIKKDVTVDLTATRESLIRHGNELHCMFPYEEKDADGNYTSRDTWLSALHAQRRGHEAAGMTEEAQKDEQELALYTAVKNCITNFYRRETGEASGFDAVLKAWFQFKDHFIDADDFSTESNQILSRCIIHLQEMRSLENDYCIPSGMSIPSPYDFFVGELGKKKYTPQTERNGISVFPYKLSAQACFACQFVINAGQKQIDVQYGKLSFLNAAKRAKLRLIQDTENLNASEAFAYLYSQDVYGKMPDSVRISSAEQTFDGFSIPHSCLDVQKDVPCLDESDYMLNEKKWIRNSCSGEFKPEILPRSEIESLILWKKNSTPCAKDPGRGMLREKAVHSLIQGKEYVLRSGIEKCGGQIKRLKESGRDPKVIEFLEGQKSLLEKYGKAPYSELPKISARAELEYFFPCPRLWTLARLLKLRPDSLDISLIKSYEFGQLNHGILEAFMKEYQGSTLPYYSSGENAFIKDGKDVSLTVKKQIQDAAELTVRNFSRSPLVTKIISIQEEQLSSSLYDFLSILLVPYGSSVTKDGERKNIAGIGNCTVYGIENSCVMPSEDGSYMRLGIIDCLLKPPRMSDADTEGWIIIDYKISGSSIPASAAIWPDENGLLHDFQMPMYVTLVRGQSEEKEIAASYFYSVRIESQTQKRAVIDRYAKTKTGDLSLESFEPALAEFRRCSDMFAEKCMDVPEPYISYDGTDSLAVRAERDCAGCSYKSICRTTYTIAGRTLQEKPGESK